jgi:hypothetical protein
MKWVARICSILLALFWLGIIWLVVINSEDPTPPSGWAMLTLALLACASLFAAWQWPRLGGVLAMIAAVAFAVVNSFVNGAAPGMSTVGLAMAAPISLTGLLFVLHGYQRTGAVKLSRAAGVIVSVLVILLALAMLVLSLGLGVNA